MATYRETFNYIFKELSAVEGAGIVFDHEPLSESTEDYVAKFGVRDDNGELYLAGWTMERNASSPEGDAGGEGAEEPNLSFSHSYLRTYDLTLRGYRSFLLDRNSAEAFGDTVEAVLDKFDTDPTLGDLAAATDPMTESVNEPRFFGDTLVHYAELHFRFYLHKVRAS